MAPTTELRCKIPWPVMVMLSELQGHLGQGRAGAIAFVIAETHQRILAPTHWGQQQAHAWRVLRRLKPEVMLAVEEVIGVSFLDGGDRVCIHVTLNPQPYQVSRKEWEK